MHLPQLPLYMAIVADAVIRSAGYSASLAVPGNGILLPGYPDYIMLPESEFGVGVGNLRKQ